MSSVFIAEIVNKVLSPLGVKIARTKTKNFPKKVFPVEASERDLEILNTVLRFDKPDKALTMTSMERVWAVIQATKYIVHNNIEGDFVECGVWRGGCALAMAMVLSDLKSDKKIYLFDTFEGMTMPTEFDKTRYGTHALDTHVPNDKGGLSSHRWAYASLEDVKEQFINNSVQSAAVFIKGDVLKTLKSPENIPKKISLLRLDTDFYESTKLEMDILFPKIEKNGILLIDDYGDWQGCKKAIDEYFESNQDKYNYLFWMTDKSSRGLIKT